MLLRHQPDRIQITFDDRRLGGQCRVDPTGHVGPCTWAYPNWLTGAWTWAVP